MGERKGVFYAGPHRVEVEPPDIIHLHLEGPIDAPHIATVLERIDALTPPLRAFVLRDGRRGGTPTRAARELVVRDPRIVRIRAIITYGASFHSKVAVGMVDKAMHALRSEMPRVHAVATEAEARAIIAAERARH